MLGYKGRSNRREFIGAAALLSIGPLAFSMALIPAIPVLMGGLSRDGAVFVGLLLTLLVLLVMAVWFWGWTVVVTRRARDIGWPAWTGVVVTGGLMVLAALTFPAVLYGWVAVMAVLRGDAFRRKGETPAEIFA